MAKNIKISVIVLFAVAFLVIIGRILLGSSAPVSQDAFKSDSVKTQPADDSDKAGQNTSLTQENLPVADGNVDHTVDAIIEGANREGAQATSDDNDAKTAAATDSQAVDETGAGL